MAIENTVITTVEITAICHGQLLPKEEIAQNMKVAIENRIPCDQANVLSVQIFEHDMPATSSWVLRGAGFECKKCGAKYEPGTKGDICPSCGAQMQEGGSCQG